MAAENLRTPYQIINQLRDRMYVAGETGGNFNLVIEGARDELADYVAKGRDPAAFVRKEAGGMTPLLLAALMGYGEIVAELLHNKEVTGSINEASDDGGYPWFYANLAYQGGGLWVCNPTVLKNTFRYIPILVQQPYYYTGRVERPYRQTRRLLEAAGS